MFTRTRLFTAIVTATLPLALAGCVTGEEAQDAVEDEIEVTTPVHEPEKEFEVAEVEPLVTKEIKGERVKDPAMPLSYKWQGTRYAPNGSVAYVAVTNESDVPMPADALRPTMRYNVGGGEMRDAALNTSPEATSVDIVGLDLPLGPGATVNAKFPFDVSTGNLWDAEFTIGNVTFKGNLNN